MATQIKFGTSGWRAIVAEEFTFANVRRAVSGIAKFVAKRDKNPTLIVGRDPRFLGEAFVAEAAAILASHGVKPLIIHDAAPTPGIAWEIMTRKTGGAINFTASHNPPEYNGIKYSTPDGAPALPETTKGIEAEIAALESVDPVKPKSTDPEAETIDIKANYLSRLKEVIDLAAIKKSGLKIVYDPLWGAARGYPDSLLRDAGIPIAAVHDVRDVLFGGHAPEPDDHLLNDLRSKMKETGAGIGIATDGDADRFGIVDADGTFIQPNYIIALLFDYLVDTRGWKNGVAKSVATTNLINALAEHHKVELHETPVGFKYIGELIKQDKIAIGGEESAGLSIRHHVPEKDGVLACLLCCEMVAKRGKAIGTQLHELFGKVGSFYPERQNFHLTPEQKEKFTTKLKSEPKDFHSKRVSEINRKDGLKLVLDDGSWVCYRVSGTEPVVRAYTEARSEQGLKDLSSAAKQFVFG